LKKLYQKYFKISFIIEKWQHIVEQIQIQVLDKNMKIQHNILLKFIFKYRSFQENYVSDDFEEALKKAYKNCIIKLFAKFK
jgi:hypothetical protein